MVFVGLGFLPERAEIEELEEDDEFDAFAGGYPVPPMTSSTPVALSAQTPSEQETIRG